jgi:hypothetical protein
MGVTMKLLCFEIKMTGFTLFTSLRELEQQVGKFRELRDSYRAANKAFYGEHLAGLLDD